MIRAIHVVCRDCRELETVTESEAFAEAIIEAHESENPDHTVESEVVA